MAYVYVSCGSVVVSKHGLYAGGPGSIPTAVATVTAAGGDAEHVSLNHTLASPWQKYREDRYLALALHGM